MTRESRVRWKNPRFVRRILATSSSSGRWRVMKTNALLRCLPIATLVVTACADDPSQPSGNMKIYETCLQTMCDQMTQDQNQACSACTSACFNASYNCDPTTACSDSCSGGNCSDGSRAECNEYGFNVTLPDNPSPDVQAACSRELAHIVNDCGDSPSNDASACDRYAATEPAEMAPYYDCVVALACASLTDATALQACNPPASTFGDDFCASLASACPSRTCPATQQASLDDDGAWVRSDALDAARSCLSQPSCGETQACISAWQAAVE